MTRRSQHGGQYQEAGLDVKGFLLRLGNASGTKTQTITSERAMRLVAAHVDAVRPHVADRGVLDAIGRKVEQLEAVSRRGASASAAPSVVVAAYITSVSSPTRDAERRLEVRVYRLFVSPDRVLKVTRLRVVYLLALVALFALTEFGRFVYRPYVYGNGIDDFGIADTMGNSLGTLTQIALGLCLVNATRIQGVRIVAFVTLGYIVYEFLQPVLPRGTFDWHDVAATLAAGAVAALMVLSIHTLSPDHEQAVHESNGEDGRS